MYCLLKIATFFLTFTLVNTDCLNTIANGKSTKTFLDNIFNKYAADTNKMTLTEFTQLLAKFEIGKLVVKCSNGDADCSKELHVVQNNRRDIPDAYNISSHKSHMQVHNTKVLLLLFLLQVAKF